MDNWTAGFVDLPAGRIAYHRTGGDLPALVLAHGLTDNGLCWRRTARELGDDFDVVMLDARGHGQSARVDLEAADSPFEDVAGVIHALGLEKPVVMGHSMGARTMAMVANNYPDTVSRVVLEDPPFMPLAQGGDNQKRAEGFRKQVARFASMRLTEIEAFGRQTNPTWHTDEFEAWAISKQQVDPNVMASFRFVPWQETIDRITAPTLLIHGDAALGGIVSEAIAEEARRLNPCIQTAHIPGAGHNTRRENFEAYMVAVRAFLLGAG